MSERPTTGLVDRLDVTDRFDFDEELLPEDSWVPDEASGILEVEAILDDDLPLSTSTDRTQRRFLVKWVERETPTWEPLSNLSCGGLLFDYLRQKKRGNRLKMVQVADESYGAKLTYANHPVKIRRRGEKETLLHQLIYIKMIRNRMLLNQRG